MAEQSRKTYYDITRKQSMLIFALDDAGFKARWHGPGPVPIILEFDTDCETHRAYLTFDDPATCYGATVETLLDEPGRPPYRDDIVCPQMQAHFKQAVKITYLPEFLAIPNGPC